MRVFAGVLAGGFVAIAAYVVLESMTALQLWFAEVGALALLCGRVLIGVGVAGGLIFAWWWMDRHNANKRRMVDGALPVMVFNLLPWTVRVLNTLQGKPSPRAIYDPTMNAAPYAIVHDQVYLPTMTGEQLTYALAVEKTNRTRAAITGDGVKGAIYYTPEGRGGGVANAATGRMLAGAYDRPDKPVKVEPPPAVPQLPAPAPADLTINDAVRSATPDWWTIGQANGQLVGFNPMHKPHIGIVGSTGTGKTTGMGFLIAAHALRNGWHVVVLDADDGAAWTAFSMQAERVETDGATFAKQIGAVYTEFERRVNLLHTTGATDINGVANVRRMLVVIEEYGDLVRQLRIRDKTAADTVDSQLDGMMRRGRKAGVHLMLLDQYPEYWSQQVIAGAKLLCIYRLGPGQGNKVGYYSAHELTDTGEFAVDGQRCRSWHIAPALRKMLADVPALDVRARVIDGVCSVSPNAGEGVSIPEVANAERVQPNATDRTETPPIDPGPTDLQSAVWAWRDANPDGTQAQLRNDFEARGIDIARGYAHELWHKWPGAVSPAAQRMTVEEFNALRQQGADISFSSNGGVFGWNDTGGKKKGA